MMLLIGGKPINYKILNLKIHHFGYREEWISDYENWVYLKNTSGAVKEQSTNRNRNVACSRIRTTTSLTEAQVNTI
jgi:hypothetical protein